MTSLHFPVPTAVSSPHPQKLYVIFNTSFLPRPEFVSLMAQSFALTATGTTKSIFQAGNPESSSGEACLPTCSVQCWQQAASISPD